MITLEGAWPKEPKPKKISRKTLKNKLDKVWSAKILKRNNGRCEVCRKKATQPHHIVGKKNLTLRWDLKNGVALCYTHHVGGKESAHGDSIWFVQWLMQNRSDDYNYLFEQREKITTYMDYEAKLEELNDTKTT